MKLKLMIITLALLFMNGCGSGSSSPKDPVAGNPGDNPGGNEPDEVNPTPIPKIAVGWYMRTVAKATTGDGTVYSHNTAGVFGELEESKEGKDRHDIGSYGKATFQIRFVNDTIEKGKEYYSDYRHYSGNIKKEVWTFVVKNEKVDPAPVNLATAQVRLGVEGLYTVYEGKDKPYEEERASDTSKMRALTLIDVDNQRTYSYDEVKTATLSMQGLHIRTFRWVLGDVDNADMEAQSKLETLSEENVNTQSIAADFTNTQNTETSKFGTPPE